MAKKSCEGDLVNSQAAYRLPNKTAAFLWHYLCLFKQGFLFLSFTAIAFALCQTIFPYFIKVIINLIHTSNQHHTLPPHLFWTMTWMCFTWAVMQIIISVQIKGIGHIMPTLKINIKTDIFNLVSQYAYPFYLKHSASLINKKINALADSTEKSIQLLIFNLLTIIIILFASMLLMFYVSIFFTILMFAWLTVHGLITKHFIKQGVSSEHEYTQSTHQASAYTSDLLDNIMNLRFYNAFAAECLKIGNLFQREKKTYQQAITHFQKMRVCQGICSAGYMIATILLLVFFWQQQMVSIGDFAMIAMLAISATNIIWQSSNHLMLLARELGVLGASLNIIQYHDVPNEDKPIVVSQIDNIIFKQVYFSYDKKTPLFYDLNFTIHAGDKIGIYDTSGFGKTTLIRLLLGLYACEQGEILINNVNIAHIDKSSLYQCMSILTQEVTLLNTSIAENILFSQKGKTQFDIERAAKIANCHAFIKSLDDGYETIVGEKGMCLSGGQRQRIALARLILHDAPMVIMDEPSSALDHLTETIVCNNLKDYLSNKTVIIISHKKSFFELVDKQYRLQDLFG